MPITARVNGYQSIDLFADAVERAAVITAGDVAYAAINQANRILDRTGHHLDAHGSSFVPYNTTRPFYYYPPAVRHAKDVASAKSARNKAHHALGGKGKRAGLGIRFQSYDEFKKALGRTGVDLLGADAPHMLQGVEIRVGGESFMLSGMGASDTGFATNLTEPAGLVTVGIYGTFGRKGTIAAAHNEGLGRMPQRQFFAISSSDADMILEDVRKRVLERLNRMKG